MDMETPWPKAGIGRRCGAIEANFGGYRSLMTGEAYEELTSLAQR